MFFICYAQVVNGDYCHLDSGRGKPSITCIEAGVSALGLDGCCDTCFTNGVNVIKSIQTHSPLSWTAKVAARVYRRRKKELTGTNESKE